ncbi:hypothetical protein K435DRAFT_974309 [Dendrothele bispora CBS 962.96]|uniref:Uncharacterized protein n=1 Tax=Dendrothele bispora (strain CBS 962.96) TaxID=1314807 RepID=A0A4S8KM73_DENBC|nr:hypothetical protein K435DRAFT_974309 [Dendrothele bispora CBS 962.96]
MSFYVSTVAVEAVVDPRASYSTVSQSLVSRLDPEFYGLCFTAPLTVSLNSYAFTVPTTFIITDSVVTGNKVLVGQDFLGACQRAGFQLPELGITNIPVSDQRPLVNEGDTSTATSSALESSVQSMQVATSSSLSLARQSDADKPPSSSAEKPVTHINDTTPSSHAQIPALPAEHANCSSAGRPVTDTHSDTLPPIPRTSNSNGVLRDVLLGSSIKGVRCSVFTDDIPALHRCAANHGVDTRSLTSAYQCTLALIFHIMTGRCFHSSLPACRNIAKDLLSAQVLSKQAFELVCSANSKLLKLDRLRLVACAVGIDTKSKSRRDIIGALLTPC